MNKHAPRRVHILEDPKRRPLAPEALVDAVQDRVGESSGRLISSTPVVLAKESGTGNRALELADELRTVIAKALQRKTFQGIEVVIDRPKGFVQTGKDANGEEWSREYKVDYGFIRRTNGGDGKELDVFLGDDSACTKAHWVRQVKSDGTFDEFKLFLGFESRALAKACYVQHIPKEHFGTMITTPIALVKAAIGIHPEEVNKREALEGETFTEHARNWVESRGLLDDDSEYGGELGRAVLRMAELFSSEEHSWYSARAARGLFNSICDTWEGVNTLILNDNEYRIALEALLGIVRKSVELFGTPEELPTDTSNRSDVRIVQVGKADSEERYVLGIVLEPEVVDSQGDIYSADEIRKAAHAYMRDFQNIGLQHKQLVNDKVSLLESFIAPADFELQGSVIKAGTWLMATRIHDDALWALVKAGGLTGYSIGGVAAKTELTSS